MRKLILVLNILVMMVCAVWGQDEVWNGESADHLNPIADNENVYHISTAAQLAKLAELVNDGNGFKGKTVILQKDIVLNVGVLDKDGNLQGDVSELNLWRPIGKNYQNSFKGTFDGNNKTVSGVYIDDGDDGAYLGLFGCLGEYDEQDGEIKNVGVVDSYVKGTGRFPYVGGVCGYSYGSISNSYNAGSVTGETENTGEGNTSSAYVGGVCGLSSGGTISNCYNIGSVTGEGKEANGWGYAFVGGVCGSSSDYSSISNCYNAGSVTGEAESLVSVGGVCGDNNGEITGCYYLEVDGVPDKGIGNEDNNEDKTKAAQPQSFAEAMNDLLVGDLKTPWIGKATANGDDITFPTLAQVPKLEEGVYLISSAEELRWFAGKVNANNSNLDGKLIQDIEVSGLKLDEDGKPDSETISAELEQWTPIGKDDDKPFTGTFDGNGYKVLGVYINDNTDNAYLGLFGYLGYGGKIENVGVVDSFVKGTGAEASVGGVCGLNFGTISNSYNAGSVEGGNGASVGGVCGYSEGLISNSYNTGSIEGGESASVGGVCGYSYGSISNSYNTGSIEGGESASVGGVCGDSGGSGKISNSYNTGSVEGGKSASVGGVCGYGDDFNSISNSYNVGSVEGGESAKVGGVCGYSRVTISDSYNVGSVEGGKSAFVGGVCGSSFSGANANGSDCISSITNSYNAGSVEGGDGASVGGVCGDSDSGISSYNRPIISLITNSYNAGSVTGGSEAKVGGVCGYNGGGIYVEDLPIISSITNSYNAGSVTGEGEAKVGGVCGYNNGGEITACFYLVGTAMKGVGAGTDSGNEKADPKTAKDLANEMNDNLEDASWIGSANYENATLTLPYFEGCEPPTVELEVVAVTEAIDFEKEEVKSGASYEVATDLSFSSPLPSGKITWDDNSTIYVRNKTVDPKEISDVIALSRPASPTLSADEEEITATSITLKATTDIEGKDIEYRKESTDESPTIAWQPSPTFGDLTPETEYIFYARIQATESSFASLPIEVNIKTKKGYTITIDAGITNGTVKTDKTIASEGEIVTLTVTPDKDYELETLNVTGTNVSGSGNERTFKMPAKAVTVTATFKEVKPAPAPDPTPDPEPVYYTVTIPESITGAIIHGGGTHQVREGSYIDFSIEIDPAGTGEYPTVTVDGYWWNTLRPDTRGNYRVYVYDDDCDIRIGEVSGYGTYTLTLPADSLFEGDDLYRSGVGIAVTPASSSPSSDALRYPFGTELTLTAVSDRHRAFVEWMDGSRRSPLTFRLREDTEAYAWFRALHPVGNEEIAAASIRIRTERGGTIVVDTPTRLPIAIYALSGQCLRRSESEGTTRFSGLREGSYLVVVGTHSEVVIVR